MLSLVQLSLEHYLNFLIDIGYDDDLKLITRIDSRKRHATNH